MAFYVYYCCGLAVVRISRSDAYTWLCAYFYASHIYVAVIAV